MKKFDIKDVFSWSNAEEAKQYIGKNCYFADSLSYLKDSVNKDRNYMLKEVFDNEINHVQGVFCDVDGDLWGLCLPADKAKEVEEPKKWRPFKDLDDLKTYANKSVGSVLVYRQKNKDNTMRTSVITDYVFNADFIFIGNRPFSFETLFEEYELLNEHGIWQPFGVLDES